MDMNFFSNTAYIITVYIILAEQNYQYSMIVILYCNCCQDSHFGNSSVSCYYYYYYYCSCVILCLKVCVRKCPTLSGWQHRSRTPPEFSLFLLSMVFRCQHAAISYLGCIQNQQSNQSDESDPLKFVHNQI